MNGRLTFLVLIIILPSFTWGQQRKSSIVVEEEVLHLLVDRAGDFYLVLGSGEINKYNKLGLLIGTYNNDGLVPTLFEPSNGVNLMAYYKGQNRYTLLKPDLEFVSFQTLDPALAIDPNLVCPSGERYLWILDGADFSLKRIDPELPLVISEFVIGGISGLKSIREYQNYLFLLHQNGISVYNNLGLLVREIKAEGISQFNFFGEELYYLSEGRIKFFNLFTGEIRILEISQEADQVVLTDEIMVLVHENRVTITSYNP